MVVTPPLHWLSLRVRFVCVGVLAISMLLPPYIPPDALAAQGEGQEVLARSSQFLFVEDGFLMKTSPLTKQGIRRTLTDGAIVTVEAGQSIGALASTYKVSQDTIRWANDLEPGTAIQPGMELLILPVDGVLHTVTRGQTLTRIAELYGIDEETIAAQNKVEDGFIVAGQQLIIPGGKPIFGRSALALKPPAFNLPPIPTAKPPPTSGGGGGSTATPRAQEFTESPTNGILQMPCENCIITQYFHEGHYALDIATPGAGPIFAANDGTVIQAENDGGWHGGYGNVIKIDHGDGMVTLYGHNKEVYVNVGDEVTRGQVIAWMGRTGLVYGATGIHTHFEVVKDGVKRNPLLYLQE